MQKVQQTADDDGEDVGDGLLKKSSRAEEAPSELMDSNDGLESSTDADTALPEEGFEAERVEGICDLLLRLL
jgi:hypothetical protein